VKLKISISLQTHPIYVRLFARIRQRKNPLVRFARNLTFITSRDLSTHCYLGYSPMTHSFLRLSQVYPTYYLKLKVFRTLQAMKHKWVKIIFGTNILLIITHFCLNQHDTTTVLICYCPNYSYKHTTLSEQLPDRFMLQYISAFLWCISVTQENAHLTPKYSVVWHLFWQNNFT